jgi:dihydroorotate dehydrogenase
MGLNNHGVDVIAPRLAASPRPAAFPLGVNVVKTHDPAILGRAGVDDFVASAAKLLPLADFLVLNVSCPNTTEGKTFESPDALAPLLDAVMAEHARQGSNVPVLVKLSPPASVDFDPGEVDELVDLSLERGISGFVATNTASDRAGLRTDAARLDAIGRGGLSGAPLAQRAEALVRHLFRRAGDRATIVGVGGIDSPEAAYRRIRAGAHLVELYTGLVYEGPGLVRRTLRHLAERIESDGLESVEDAVGLDA